MNFHYRSNSEKIIDYIFQQYSQTLIHRSLLTTASSPNNYLHLNWINGIKVLSHNFQLLTHQCTA